MCVVLFKKKTCGDVTAVGYSVSSGAQSCLIVASHITNDKPQILHVGLCNVHQYITVTE